MAPPSSLYPSQTGIDRAAQALMSGDLVGMPTETVYGLAGDATNDAACARIFTAKKRPEFNPLIAHMADIDMAQRFVQFSTLATTLAESFWPGPLTLVLPRKDNCALSLLTSAGLSTQGVRVPAHKTAHALIRKLARPIAAPSANTSGKLSPTTAGHVRNDLGPKVAMILDAGPSSIGVESTILKITKEETAELLRPGGISVEKIESIVNVVIPHKNRLIEASGMQESHYAPGAKLRLNAHTPYDDEVFLGFGGYHHEDSLNLSPGADLLEAASKLFSCLHALDQQAPKIAVAPIPSDGLGLAINDRLRRAAAPRPSDSSSPQEPSVS